MQQQQIMLAPAQVSATFAHGTLTIVAEGTEEGVAHIRIVQSPTAIVPNTVFAVVGERTPAIGDFPYQVTARFHMERDPGHIEIERLGGRQIVPVRRG
jgi:hypothetical protein